MNKTDYLLIGFTLLLGFLFKYLYSICSTEDLLFLLWPTHLMIEIMTGSVGIYQDGMGYDFSSLNIVINRSCSGLNFFVISFCMIVATTIPRFSKNKQKVLATLFFFIASYLLTIFANSARILGAIMGLRFSDLHPFLGSEWFHQAEGTFVYLSLLLLYYLAISTWFIPTPIQSHKIAVP